MLSGNDSQAVLSLMAPGMAYSNPIANTLLALFGNEDKSSYTVMPTHLAAGGKQGERGQ